MSVIQEGKSICLLTCVADFRSHSLCWACLGQAECQANNQSLLPNPMLPSRSIYTPIRKRSVYVSFCLETRSNYYSNHVVWYRYNIAEKSTDSHAQMMTWRKNLYIIIGESRKNNGLTFVSALYLSLYLLFTYSNRIPNWKYQIKKLIHFREVK